MVDQRRRRGGEVEQKPGEFIRQVSSQLSLPSLPSLPSLRKWSSMGAGTGCGLFNTPSLDSMGGLEEDLLVSTPMMGMDPGKDALFFGQGCCRDGWGYGLEPERSDPMFRLPSPVAFPPLGSHGAVRCASIGAYPGSDPFPGSPFAAHDVMFGAAMEEAKPDFGCESMSVDVKEEGMELGGVDSLPGGLPYEIRTRERRAEARESRRAGVPRVDFSSIQKPQAAPKVLGRSKGVTMCLRTLLRQLLAGTGWIMDSSISKDHATHLIRQLVGPELDTLLEVQLSPRRAEVMSSEDKEVHYSRILGELVSQYVGVQVSHQQAQDLIKRDKGPYHLTQEFIDMLHGKDWPPRMLSEKELRRYGCYRQGEASKRSRHD